MSNRESFLSGELNINDLTDEEATALARDFGHIPKEDFHGDPERYRDPREYLDYAQNMIPVLRTNNRQLESIVHERDAAITSLNERLAENERILKALKDDSDAGAVSSLESQIEQTRVALKMASEEGDHETQAELLERLADLKADLKEAKREKPAASTTAAPPASPGPTDDERKVFSEWQAANPWLNDPVMAAAAQVTLNQIIAEYQSSGRQIPAQRSVLDEVTRRMDNRFNISRRPGGDKVGEGSGGRGRTSSTASRGYASLSQAAKEACDAEARRKVGPDKAYKTVDEWRQRFADIYYSQPGAE